VSQLTPKQLTKCGSLTLTSALSEMCFIDSKFLASGGSTSAS